MLDVPLTVKIRTGVQEKMNVAHKIIPKIREWGASMVTVQGSLAGVRGTLRNTGVTLPFPAAQWLF